MSSAVVTDQKPASSGNSVSRSVQWTGHSARRRANSSCGGPSIHSSRSVTSTCSRSSSDCCPSTPAGASPGRRISPGPFLVDVISLSSSSPPRTDTGMLLAGQPAGNDQAGQCRSLASATAATSQREVVTLTLPRSAPNRVHGGLGQRDDGAGHIAQRPVERLPQRNGGGGAVERRPVTDEQVGGHVTGEPAGRPQPQADVHTRPLGAGSEARGGPDRLGHDQHSLAGPPQRHLAPELVVDHRNNLERGVRKRCRNLEMRHAETGGDRLAPASMAVEQLQHRGGPPELERLVERLRHSGRVDQPHPPVVDEGVRAARHRLVENPRDPERLPVERGERHDYLASAGASAGSRASDAPCSRASRPGTNRLASTQRIRNPVAIRKVAVNPVTVGFPRTVLLTMNVAAIWPPSAPPSVRMTVFMPLATPVCPGGTACTIRLPSAENASPIPTPSRKALISMS